MSATIQSITSIRSAFAACQKAVRVVVVPLHQHKAAAAEPVAVSRRKKRLRPRVALMAEVGILVRAEVKMLSIKIKKQKTLLKRNMKMQSKNWKMQKVRVCLGKKGVD